LGKKLGTEINIAQIKLAFFGATQNLYLLKEALVKIENMPIYQYCTAYAELAVF